MSFIYSLFIDSLLSLAGFGNDVRKIVSFEKPRHGSLAPFYIGLPRRSTNLDDSGKKGEKRLFSKEQNRQIGNVVRDILGCRSVSRRRCICSPEHIASQVLQRSGRVSARLLFNYVLYSRIYGFVQSSFCNKTATKSTQ